MIDAFFLFGPEPFYSEDNGFLFEELSNLTLRAPVERILCQRQQARQGKQKKSEEVVNDSDRKVIELINNVHVESVTSEVMSRKTESNSTTVEAKKAGRLLKRIVDKSPVSSCVTDKSQATLSPLIVTRHKKRRPLPPAEDITPTS